MTPSREHVPKINAGGINPGLTSLQARGVVILHPDSVYVDSSIAPDRIAPGVIIHPGCRLWGAATSLGPGCVLGEEAPVTLENCQLGANVKLKGGYFSGATFLDGVSFGSGAHVRPGTLLEEFASCAHAVGLKQTILMPYVVLGSLINFCDCLMAGGTDRKQHSEVGSSYVHFNYTPHRDKATPSLFGDVPRGVMLDQPPIFLGGQGGTVGPVRIEFGTVIAAGTIQRHDVTEPGNLLCGESVRLRTKVEFHPGLYGNIIRILKNNLIYIGNLHALFVWYQTVRARFLNRTPWGQACYEGALTRLRESVEERLVRLGELAARMPASIGQAALLRPGGVPEGPYRLQRLFSEHWPEIANNLRLETRNPRPPECPESLLATIEELQGDNDYIAAVQKIPREIRKAATAWLQNIVDRVVQVGSKLITSP